MRDFFGLSSIEINPSEQSDLYFQINGVTRSLFLPTDKPIGMKVFFDQCWDPRKVKFFRLIAQNLGHDITLVDVGANVGLFTRQCVSHLSGRGKAFCYEPSPSNFRLLERNLGGVEGVRLSNKGLSSRDGGMILFEDPEHSGGHTLNPGAVGVNSNEIEVRIVDASREERYWIETGNRIFYKSDTESHDEVIATTLSDEFWRCVEAGTMELRAVGGKIYDVERLEEILDQFPNKVFESNPKTQLGSREILNFAQGIGNQYEDLLFWR